MKRPQKLEEKRLRKRQERARQGVTAVPVPPPQQATHPVYNLAPEKVLRAVMHFLQLPVPVPGPAGTAE